jgi:HD superfamily phosphohydrolase
MNINVDHEQMTEKMIKNMNGRNYLFNQDAVLDILFNTSNIYHSIISSKVDVDKMDYILRDLKKIGPYSEDRPNVNFKDITKIIYSFSLKKDQFPLESKNAIENLLNTRNWLFKYVYKNKHVLAIENEIVNDMYYYLSENFKKSNIIDPKTFLYLTDYSVLPLKDYRTCDLNYNENENEFKKIKVEELDFF